MSAETRDVEDPKLLHRALCEAVGDAQILIIAHRQRRTIPPEILARYADRRCATVIDELVKEAKR